MLYARKNRIPILITVETGCVVAPPAVDWIFYRNSLFLSIPGVTYGAFTLVGPVVQHVWTYQH